MSRFRATTKRGYSLFDVASALQKSIRRSEAGMAVYFAIELADSGFRPYVWKRLLVISAEDCSGCITQEIKALHDAFVHVNKGVKAMDKPEGRLFISKAAILLSEAMKSRDADHAIIYLYDREKITTEMATVYIDQIPPEERLPIPEYAFDCHTSKGKAAGKTKADFLKDEFAALKPKDKGLFDEHVGTD